MKHPGHLPAVLCLLHCGVIAQTPFFSTDFDSGIPQEVNAGTATTTGVQGYAGLGPTGNQFGGDFLRSETFNTVTLTLTGMPPHNELELDFLFAAIDSLDGTGTFPQGDYFEIWIDGGRRFREAFANALPSQIQTYVSPPGVELARRVDLGFSGPGSYYTDSAYDMAADPLFSFPHTAPAAMIELKMEGPGLQGLADESWAIDNLRVWLRGHSGSIAPYGLDCGPRLSATGSPTLGMVITLDAVNLPTSSLTLAMVGFRNDSYLGFPLPGDLSGFGIPGCWLNVAPAGINIPMAGTGPAATTTVQLPSPTAFTGLQLYFQALALASPLLQFSNGVRIIIGP